MSKNNLFCQKKIDIFVEINQDKYFCACGCEESIGIQRYHYHRGMPKYISGHNSKINNPMLGGHHSKKSKETQSKIKVGKNNPMFGKPSTKGMLGKHHTGEWRLQRSEETRGEKNPFYGKKHTKKVGLKKEKHPNWKGGISKEPYNQEWTKELRDRIRNRDNHICQLCMIKESDLKKKLTVHHIDYDKKNCDEGNLIALCHSCNIKVNYNRVFWTGFITGFIYLKKLIELKEVRS